MFKRTAFVALATAAVVSFGASTESASAIPAAVARWEQPQSIKVFVDSSVNGQGWQLERAIKVWSSGVLEVKAVSDPAKANIKVTSGVPNPNWKGISHYAHLDRVFVSCDIELATDTPPKRRPWVAAHELGHCLGLPHVNEKNSIMDLWSRNQTTTKVPQAFDLAWIEDIYAS